MSEIDKKSKQLLIEQWVPVLRETARRRRPILLLSIIIMVIPLVIAVSLIIHQIQTGDVTTVKAITASGLLGLCAFTAVFVCKLQQCNDSLLVVEAALYLGDREQFLKAMSHLMCLGRKMVG